MLKCFGHKYTIVVGLVLQAVQLSIYGVWTAQWIMWPAGVCAALSSIVYPAVSGLVSRNAEPEQQG